MDSPVAVCSALAACLALCCAAQALVAAFASALAAKKFPQVGSAGAAKSAKPDALSASAKFFLERSDRAGAAISMLRAALLALSAFCVATGAREVFDMRQNWLGTVAAFALSIPVLLALQRAFFDLPFSALGRRSAAGTLNRLSKPFFVVYAIFAPLEFLAQKLGTAILGNKHCECAPFEYLDVEVMLRAQNSEAESISPYAGKILNNALRLSELDVSDVMLPRSQVAYMDTEAANSENIAIALEKGYTRYPLCRDNLDNCLGFVHIKDILNFVCSNESADSIDLMKIRRDTIRLKETDKLESAMMKMLKYKLHMAVVEDEFGGNIGVLTLDAALSQLVGKIRDEFDSAAQDKTIQAAGKNRYRISGSASLHRVEDFLDVDFETDEVSTFGGLITLTLGRFPEPGERILFSGQRLRVTVESVGERMVGDCVAEIEEPEREA